MGVRGEEAGDEIEAGGAGGGVDGGGEAAALEVSELQTSGLLTSGVSPLYWAKFAKHWT